jgi:hypothetical protein
LRQNQSQTVFVGWALPTQGGIPIFPKKFWRGAGIAGMGSSRNLKFFHGYLVNLLFG